MSSCGDAIRAGGNLPGQPEIRADFPGRKLPIARVVDGSRKGGPALGRLRHVLPGLDGAVNSPGVAANDGCQGFTSLKKGLAHALKTNTFRKSRKRNTDKIRMFAENQILTQNVGMRTWNRDLFVRLVKEKRDAGVSDEEIARALGDISTATLQGYLDQRGRAVSKKLLEFAPAYLGVELEDLWLDDASEDQVELRRARAMVRETLGKDRAADFTDEAALKWYRMAKNLIAAHASD